MGNLLRVPGWRKRRKATEELDEIVERLSQLEGKLKANLENRSRYLGLLLCTTLFLISVLSAYFWFRYSDLKSRALILPSLVLISFSLFLLFRSLIVAFFNYLINRNKRSIHSYTERKIAIIEDVKENEKFKVAKEIIEKYGPKDDDLSKIDGAAEGSVERNKPVDKAQKVSPSKPTNQASRPPLQPTLQHPQNSTTSSNSPSKFSPIPTHRMPKLNEIGEGRFRREPVRPFVEKSDSVVDRLLDYVMGEGITNRYALICSKCHQHNGMALREEFEQISFHCYRCNSHNPSRNELKTLTQRASHSPAAPEQPRGKEADLVGEFYSLTPPLPEPDNDTGSSSQSQDGDNDNRK